MKLSSHFPLAALASLVTAVPTSISFSVSFNDGSLHNSINKHVDACTRACYVKQQDCGEGNYAWQSGNCWFCCNCSSRPHHPMKDAEDFAKSLVTQASTDVGKYHPENMPLIQKGPGDVCWLICGNKPIKCPKGWYSQKSGPCWTCCKCSSAPWDVITGIGNELPATNAEIEPFAEDL